MTTNNHPAHGPVSLDRLHQISEILSKAAAQSDGGNLGYAMADAVKVVDGVIAAFGAEPVIVVGDDGADALSYRRLIQSFAPGTKLYASPQLPQPSVPDALPEDDDEEGNDIDYLEPSKVYELGRIAGWNACRSAMLQAGNSPAVPDGYVLVPKEITCAMDDAAWEAYHETRCMSDIWAALLASAPQKK
ncbi:hypothetical protein DPP06_13060 [Salmonella enterica subsp. enterica]|nr:hypothetical protein [Salmonella enterica subsp. enterica]